MQYFELRHEQDTIAYMKINAAVPIVPLKRILFLRIALCTTVLVASLFSTEAIKAQENNLSFIHTERSLQPGEVVLYDIHSSRPLNELHLEAFDRRFPAFAVDGAHEWKCLVGIDRDTEPGRYNIKLSGVDEGGKNISDTDVLVVIPKEFPTRKLTVEPKYVTPPAEVQDRIQKERALVDSIFNATTFEKLWDGPFNVPVPGVVISEFGKRSVYNGQPRSAHSGTDFRGAVGTPIHAPNSGRVVFTGNLYYTGHTVIIDHGLGMYSYLGHMSAITATEGQNVQTADLVGEVGATGRVTGPHLHWTVRLGISRVDPISLIDVLKKYPAGEL